MRKPEVMLAILLATLAAAAPAFAQAQAGDTVTSSRPVFIENARRVAYISRAGHGLPSQVHVVSADGQRDQIVAGTTGATDVLYSPDERRILFRTLTLPSSANAAASSDAPMHYIVADADGGNAHTIAGGQTLSNGSWSPDGRQIVYTTRPGGRGVPSTILLADADGSNVRELSAGLPLVEPAVWSRSGRLAFVTVSAGGTRVVITDGLGRNARELAPAIPYQSTPVWSPDGRQVAFRGAEQPMTPGAPKHLYVANADGTGLHQVIEEASGLLEAQFSPDGTKLVYSTSRNRSTTNTDIYISDVSGGNERQLTTEPAYDEDPSWSRDGTHILFQSTRSGTAHVYIMDTNGHGVRLIR